MKKDSWISILLLVGLALAGCDRNSNRTQGARSPAVDSNLPAAPAQVLSSPVAPTIEPALPPAGPTQAPTMVPQPAESSAIDQAASDLSSALDGLAKDLDSTDTLNDVK